MDIEQNNFRRNAKGGRGGCLRCLCQAVRVVRFFPFALITVFYCWGIYVYLYYVIYGFYQSLVLRGLLVLFFVPFYTLSIWSYFRTVFAAHRPMGFEFYLPEELSLNRMTEEEINQQLENVIQARNLPVFTRAYNGSVRYCRKCLIIKPDRAHHCSTCGKCICKMDHHCHWVSNCVAFDNYKFFLQFLTYTVLLAFYVVASSVQLFIKFWKEESYPGKFQVFFLVVFCFIFSISILFLLSYHIYLVCRNITTLEAYQPPRFKQFEYDYYRFNLGTKRNVMSVFGDSKLYWFLPIYSSLGDGVQYEMPLNPGQYDKSNNLTCTNPTAQSNASFPIMNSQVANI